MEKRGGTTRVLNRRAEDRKGKEKETETRVRIVGESGGRQCGRDHTMFCSVGGTCVWKIESNKIRIEREKERGTKRYNSII